MSRHIGPIALMVLGAVLVGVHLAGRWLRPRMSEEEMRAGYRLLWDLGFGAGKLLVFAAYMFAPRHVMPGQRIPVPKARRMVRAYTSGDARKMIR